MTLEGIVGAPAEQPEVMARSGVRGNGIWLTGVRAKPFQLRSGVDLETLDIGRSLWSQYRSLISADPVEIVWAGVQISLDENLVFKVLDVQIADHFRLPPTAVGGIRPPSLAWLDCVWTLLPIERTTAG
ncbi:MAG TPA: hypothetical protein VGE52_14010 [Pirellulales bacterium]